MKTTPTNPRDLDQFETALLTELRHHVAARPVAETVFAEPTRHHWGRWAAGLAVAAATATAVVIAWPGGPGASPAYAISENADGDVVVTIHRLEDSAGLEAALRDKGIEADVSFDPDNITTKDGVTTFTLPDGGGDEAPPAEGGSTDLKQESAGGGPSLDSDTGAVQEARPPEDGELPAIPDCGGTGGGEPATLTHEGDDWVLRIPAGSPAQDRPVQIGTMPNGALSVTFAGDTPNSQCGFMSVGEQD